MKICCVAMAILEMNQAITGEYWVIVRTKTNDFKIPLKYCPFCGLEIKQGGQ